MILSTKASVLIDVDPKQVDVTDMPIIALKPSTKSDLWLIDLQNSLLNGCTNALWKGKSHLRQNDPFMIVQRAATRSDGPCDGMHAHGLRRFICEPWRKISWSIGHPRTNTSRLFRSLAKGNMIKVTCIPIKTWTIGCYQLFLEWLPIEEFLKEPA